MGKAASGKPDRDGGGLCACRVFAPCKTCRTFRLRGLDARISGADHMKKLIFIATLCMTGAASAQGAGEATGGVLRVLDKVTGAVTDLSLKRNETGALGHLAITLNECRFPASNPNGDAYAKVTVMYRDIVVPAFQGWMIASAPALNAMDHPRYDVWALRCITS